MQGSQELMDAIFRERVLRARRTPPEQKVSAGYEMFLLGCEMSRAGIRMQRPNATAEEVEQELSRRLRIGEMLERRELESAGAASYGG